MPVPISTTGFALSAGEQSYGGASPEIANGASDLFARLKAEPAAPPVATSPQVAEKPLGPAAPAVRADASETNEDVIVVSNLNFTYPGIDGAPIPGLEPLIRGMDLKLQRGARCLLVGPNGAGKSTLLRILAGKHMVPETAVRVLGQSAFHETSLVTSGKLRYIGGDWNREVAFSGYNVALTGDFPASQMWANIPNLDQERKKRILEVLDVDESWRMHIVSDGQRRRVQLAYGLMVPAKVLLLDEITVDLDVLGRADLLRFLEEECEQRGVCVIYVTHISDGLEDWATHLCYVADGDLKVSEPAANIPELAQGDLLHVVERWLREAKAEKEKKEAEKNFPMKKRVEYARNNGWGGGRMSSTTTFGDSLGGQGYDQHSSNSVMRM